MRLIFIKSPRDIYILHKNVLTSPYDLTQSSRSYCRSHFATHSCFPPNIYFKRPLSQSCNMTKNITKQFHTGQTGFATKFMKWHIWRESENKAFCKGNMVVSIWLWFYHSKNYTSILIKTISQLSIPKWWSGEIH